MSKLDQLRACSKLKDLAMVLDIEPKSLAYIIHVIPDHQKYKYFSIPKKNGGIRTISAPVPKLKMAQKRLASVLSDCLFEIESKSEVLEHCALSHGFIKRRSIITNAKRHRNRRYVFNLDVENFFPSIHFGRVRGFFMKSRSFGLAEPVATAIAQIACHNGVLPQGSPCSPVISNLIAHILDIHLNKFASSNACTYTRYADDMTFSTNKKIFPAVIGKPVAETPHRWSVGDELAGRIFRAGFRINQAKTRMQYQNSRQDATGLIVNEKVNVPVEYYKRARAMCHSLVTTGEFFFPEQTSPAVPAQLRGLLSFLFLVRGIPYSHKRIAIGKGETEKEIRPAFYRIYKIFLDFIHFHGNERPTIICEGKTDGSYLADAIKALATAYPTLVSVGPNEKRLLIKFYRYSETADAVQDLAGGTGDLSKFIRGYEGTLRPLRAPGRRQPVIIVVDNDSGAAPVWAAIKHVSKRAANVDGSETFYHVIHNLYVVPIPKVGGVDTQIEAFFDAKTLGTVVNGRRFSPDENRLDPKLHYGKVDFAKEVNKRRTEVDFSAFAPILDRLVQVQIDYAGRLF